MEIKSKLNWFSCNFVDESLELNYKSSEWVRDRKKFVIKLWALLILAVLGILLELGLRANSIELDITGVKPYPPIFNIFALWIIAAYVIDILLYIWLFFSDDSKRKKFGNNIIAFAISHILLGQNVRGFYSPIEEFQLETMTVYFYPAFPIFLAILILAIIDIDFHYLTVVYLIAFIPAILMFIIKGNASILEALILIIFPAFYLLFNVYQNHIKSRHSFYFENLMGAGLRKYFGDTLTEQLIKDEGQISGQNQWVTLTFTDLAQYSTIIEKMSPEMAVEFLNEYYTAMHQVIKNHNGMILNYIGDCVMVIYGAPNVTKNHEISGVKAAIDMRQKLSELNDKWEESEFSRYWTNLGIKEVTCRTGVHCGNLIVGNIGSEDLLQYSAIGDAVNIASRLESVNKDFGTSIAISEQIYAALTKELVNKAKLEGEISLKGRSKVTNVYSL